MKNIEKEINSECDIKILSYAAKKNYKQVQFYKFLKVACLVLLSLVGSLYFTLSTSEKIKSPERVALQDEVTTSLIDSLLFTSSEFEAESEEIEQSIQLVMNDKFSINY